MSITLNWRNRNQTVSAVKIYRGTSRNTQPTLLTTIDSAATSYEDTTALNNVLYYYKVALIIGDEEVPGGLQPMMAATNVGPGPQKLISGTMEFGYFGKMLPTEFFTSAVLRTAIGTNPGYWNTASNDITWWRKYAHFGKILYIPDVPIYVTTAMNSTAIMALYTAGMFYGHGLTNKNSVITVADVVQNKKVIKDAYEFIIKAPSGNVYTPPTTAYFNTSGIDYYNSEAMLIAQPISNYSSSGIATYQYLPKIASSDTYGTNVTSVVTQHMASATQFNVQYNYLMSRTALAWAGSSTIYYLPVLQLVP